jgi:preprotein translocase subunit SecD
MHAVDEGGMRAALEDAKLPEGVKAEDAGDRVRVFGADAAARRTALAALATARGAWLVGRASDGRYEAVLAGPAALGEADLDRCSVALQEMQWGPQIAVRLTAEGGKRLADVTQANVKRRVAIVIDGEVHSAPIVQEPITGGALVIATGDRNVDAARDLVAVLRHGPLPDTLRIAR